jgi:hypothetical protein
MNAVLEPRVDRRRWTNMQRAAMGLPLKGSREKRGPYKEHESKIVAKPAIPPEVRLVKMLTEQVSRFHRMVAQDRANHPL